MAQSHAQTKYMTFGEGGTAAAFGILAIFSIVIAAKAYTPEYAFHAYLFAAGSVAAIFAIVNRYFERSPEPAPLIDRRQAELQYGPGEVRHRGVGVLGRRRLPGRRCRSRSSSPFPMLNLDLCVPVVRPPAAAAHLGGDLRLRRQRADRDLLLRRAAHLPRAAVRRRLAPWFVVLGLAAASSCSPATGYLLGITAEQGIRRARMVRRPLAHRRLGRLSARLLRHASCKRNEPHIYVANWFYLAFIVTIAVLHIVNNAAMPVSLFSPKSYSSTPACRTRMVQWWYGHNAVGFFLTAGFLGMMYYFIPKQAERPVYSLPAVDRPLLGADLHLHLGRPAPPALHRAARLGADARHGVLAHAVDAVLGRHDQRPDDAVGRLGQAAHRPGPAHPVRVASPSTACRPSKAR